MKDGEINIYKMLMSPFSIAEDLCGHTLIYLVSKNLDSSDIRI